MNKLYRLIPFALVLFAPAVAAADPPQGALVVGSAAIASFEQVSADGCTTTFGEIALVRFVVGGELSNGLYVTGMQDNTACGGFGNGFAGFAEGSGGVLGLIGARFTGTVVAESYSSGDAVTLELDLWWLGRGPVIRNGGVFHDDTQIWFEFSRQRDARVTGTFNLDGEAATVTTATLGFQVNGNLVF